MENKEQSISHNIDFLNLANDYVGILKKLREFLIKNLNNSEKIILRERIKATLEENNLLEEDNVYKAVTQTELFELIEIPTAGLFSEEIIDSEIELKKIDSLYTLVESILSYYLPAKIERYLDTYIKITLTDEEYQRFYHVQNFITDNNSWSDFFMNEQPSVYESIMRISSFFSYEHTLPENDIQLISSKEIFKKEIIFSENPSLNYLERQIFIRLNPSHGLSELFSVDGILNNLIELGMVINFISTYYPVLVELTNAEYEREQKEYLEEMTSARKTFLEKEMPRRILPIEELGHKTAIAEAKRNGIEQVFLPFIQNEAATVLSDVQFALYHKKADGEDSTSWFILPPTQTFLDLPGYTQNGVHEYVGYRPEDVFSLSGKSPHVVSQELQSYAVLDEALFHEVLLEDYKDDPVYGKLLQETNFLLEKYPQLFRKTDRTFLSEHILEEESPEKEELREESHQQKNPMMEAMKSLKVKNTYGATCFLKEGDFVYKDVESDGYNDYGYNLYYIQEIEIGPTKSRMRLFHFTSELTQFSALDSSVTYTKLEKNHGTSYTPHYQEELEEILPLYKENYAKIFPCDEDEEEGVALEYQEDLPIPHAYLFQKESPFCAVLDDSFIIFESGDKVLSTHHLYEHENNRTQMKQILLSRNNSVKELFSLNSSQMVLIPIYDYLTGIMDSTLLFDEEEISTTSIQTGESEDFPF